MPDFAIHRTRFENYSDTALYGLYRESVFTNLSPSEKLDLMQETVNRDAALQGMKGAPEVVYGDLTSEFGGCYMDGVIYMNYELIVEGEGEYPNCQALNSVFHENIHAWQDQVADGTIPAVSPELRTQYRANDASTSVVKQNGSYKMGNQYLSGITSPYLYYFQALERDAKLGAEIKTNSIIQDLIAKFGMEKSFEDYEKNMAEFGYGAMEEKAIAFYQNPDFVRDLNRVLVNQKFGTNLPVDKATEEAVKTEMVATYRELYLNQEKETEKEKETMKLDGPVTMEEYNASLQETEAQETAETETVQEETENNIADVDNEADSELGDDDLDL